MQAHVRPDRIVVVDSGVNGLQCCGQWTEGHKESELHFKDAIDAFCDGIFIRVAILRHRDCDKVFSAQCNIICAAILRTPVGMVDEVLTWADPGFVYGHLEGV